MSLRISPSSSRRNFLKLASLSSAAALTTTLWLPKSARGAPPPGAVKRVIILQCDGGVRWTATFDGQADVAHNPWGLAPWDLLGSSSPEPEWGFSRMLMQKPVNVGATDWFGDIYPHLKSNVFNSVRPVLPSWDGASLPTFADVAHETVVVRVTNNPGGDPNLDHGSASYYCATGGGSAGIATGLYHGLKLQMGANLDSYYALPPVTAGERATMFSLGYGDYASSRAVTLPGAGVLPSRDPTASVSKWGNRAEKRLDEAFSAQLPDWTRQKGLNFINDKHAAELFGGPLTAPVLAIEKNPDAALGETIGTKLPVTNQMLLELFGTNSSTTPEGDILFDAYAARNQTSWEGEAFGVCGAFAIRMLQAGVPVIALAAFQSNFDTHSGEATEHPYVVVRLARALAALEFALKNIADPRAPGASLWDSTVVFVCSEFGRTHGGDGFNVPNGANGGGSDHHPWSAMVALGGPVVQAGAGGKLVVATDNGGFFHQNRFYTSLMAAMGISAENAYLGFADYPPIPGIFAGV